MSYDFDGSNDQIDTGAWDVPAATSTITFGGWVYPDGFAIADSRIFSKAASTSEADHIFMIGNNDGTYFRPRMRLSTGVTTTLDPGTGTRGSGQWYHLLGWYDGTNAKIYIDGSEYGSMGKSGDVAIDGTVDVFIGRNPGASPYGTWEGKIAEMAFWTAALTTSEISALANGIHPLRIRQTSIYGYWPLYGNGAPDLSRNGNNGTVTGAVLGPHAPVGPMVLPAGWPPVAAEGGVSATCVVSTLVLTPPNAQAEVAATCVVPTLVLTPPNPKAAVEAECVVATLVLNAPAPECEVSATCGVATLTLNSPTCEGEVSATCGIATLVLNAPNPSTDVQANCVVATLVLDSPAPQAEVSAQCVVSTLVLGAPNASVPAVGPQCVVATLALGAPVCRTGWVTIYATVGHLSVNHVDEARVPVNQVDVGHVPVNRIEEGVLA